MKILFFIALLINIVFFMWEVNSADINSASVRVFDDKAEKQILLVSELSGENGENILITAEHHKDNIQMGFSEQNSRLDSLRTKPAVNKTGSQKNKVLNSSKGISKNELTVDTFDHKDEAKQRTSQQLTNSLSAIKQIESDRKNSQQSQKVLAGVGAGGEKNENTEELSFWPDFSFIFDKDNNYLPQMDIKSNSKEFSLAAVTRDVGNGGFSISQENWPGSIFGQPINNEESIGKNNKLSGIREQVKKNYCYEVGPFKTYHRVEEWRKSNHINASSLKRFKKNIKFASSYLVYHPAEDTFEQSKKIAKGYKKKQISDIWLFRKGDLRGAISFGLFRKQKSAYRLQKKLIKNGLNVEILERNKTREVNYARVFTKDALFKNTITISKKQVINGCS